MAASYFDDSGEALGPIPVWHFGRYTLGKYPEGAWDFSNGALGATGRSPLDAMLHWLRWYRDYRSKPPGYWAQ